MVLSGAGGGAPGLRDRRLLESALARMSAGYSDQELYPSLLEKAAILLQGVIQNHPFVDGNKRTALLAATALLQRNGVIISYGPQEAVGLAVGVAQHEVSLGEIVRWLRDHQVWGDSSG